MDGFSPKEFKGLHIETYFDFEDKSFYSIIREWDGTDVGMNDIQPLNSIRRISISSNTDLKFTDLNNNILDTINNWVKERVKGYALTRLDPSTGQPLFSPNDITQEIL